MKQLLIQLARFGDIVQSKRLVLSLMGEGEVYLCVDSSLEALARLVYPSVELIPISAHYASGNSFAEHLRVFERLRSEKFDRIYNINFSPLSTSMTGLFEPERLRGYARVAGQDLRDVWFELAFRMMKNRKLAAINLVDLWGHLADRAVCGESVNPIATPKGGGLGVVLAGRNSKRTLSVDELIPCVHSLCAYNEYPKIYLLGTKNEEKAAREFYAKAPTIIRERLVDLCGKTDYHALIDIVSSLDRVLSVDTGTMHLAAHLGTPVTALFCASAYVYETSAYGLGHEVWQSQSACSPCLESRACLFAGDAKNNFCHHAFTQAKFYQALSGRNVETLENVLHLQSDFDTLGLAWQGKHDDDTERSKLRELLAEFLTLRHLEQHYSKTVDSLFEDKDWILTRQI